MNTNLFEWGVAERPMVGEAQSGDLYMVKPLGDNILFAVADGLGHGPAASEAARLALKTVEESAHKPLVQVLENCDQRLRQTRGVVLTIALFNALDNSMEWVGVGNVQGVLVRSAPEGKAVAESLLLSRGILGGVLPPVRTAVLRIDSGDTLVLATDGVRQGFEDGLVMLETPEKTAEGILTRDGLNTDDALVLVATLNGRAR